jgi:hypothetical protein
MFPILFNRIVRRKKSSTGHNRVKHRKRNEPSDNPSTLH